MIWSEDAAKIKPITLEQIKQGERYPKLIHWAGALRTPDIQKMTRCDILDFFEKKYYEKVSFGFAKKNIRKGNAMFISFLRSVYHQIKP
jgi:hypothetical protein